MKTEQYLLAIDQGTTSSRAHVFTALGKLIGTHQMELSQSYPHPGWVEQKPNEMWEQTLHCCREVLAQNQLSAEKVAAIGITNQRETTIVWDKNTGEAIYPAIVWQDRRTAALCRELANTSLNQSIQQKTGLLFDPYFSASKIMWLLDNVRDARSRAEHGELLFGTVDTFLLWRLTNGKVHATDATNASRTMLFNIHTQQWDAAILSALRIPASLLPTVYDSSAHYGETAPQLLGKAIPITSVIGDQQAAAIGQICFEAGSTKSTYGTGCFMLLNTDGEQVASKQGLLATVAYRLNGKVTYGLEGSIFSAGSIVQWLRDQLQLITHAAETERIAERVPSTHGVYLIPALTGLGAPYWQPNARAAIVGLTRASTKAHIVRAGLEAIAYQTRDLLQAMGKDYRHYFSALRVDGGMAANNWLMQFIADMLDLPVIRPACIETTALGCAYLAGLTMGLYRSLTDVAQLWQVDKEFFPHLPATERDRLYAGWQEIMQHYSLA